MGLVQLDVKLVVVSVPADVWQNWPLLPLLGSPLNVTTGIATVTELYESTQVQTAAVMYFEPLTGKFAVPHFFLLGYATTASSQINISAMARAYSVRKLSRRCHQRWRRLAAGAGGAPIALRGVGLVRFRPCFVSALCPRRERTRVRISPAGGSRRGTWCWW